MIRRRKSRLRIWRGRGLGHLSVLCHDDLANSIFRFQTIKETFFLPEDARGASWYVCGGKQSERVETSQASTSKFSRGQRNGGQRRRDGYSTIAILLQVSIMQANGGLRRCAFQVDVVTIGSRDWAHWGS